MENLVKIAQSVAQFEVVAKVEVSSDKTDDKFIGLAIDAGAKIIISGDPDLKTIKVYEGIHILSPSHFFDRFVQKIG